MSGRNSKLIRRRALLDQISPRALLRDAGMRDASHGRRGRLYRGWRRDVLTARAIDAKQVSVNIPRTPKVSP